jgi:CDP-diacylglycerol---glycerol-3-phosphate 3-phosphatidyltransferase
VDGRLDAVVGAVRYGLAEARAVPARRWAFGGWVLVAAAVGTWTLVFVHRRADATLFASMVVFAALWFVTAVFAGYIHLGLVRREDGTPRPRFLLPNGLTFLRMSLAPLFGFVATLAVELRPDAPWVFWPLGFVIASDALDGQIARTFRMRSEWGRLADPFSDIFLVTWFAAGLWAGGIISAWLAVPIIVRYGGTLVGVFAVWSGGKPVRVEATIIGKVTNVAVSFALPSVLGAAMMWASWRDARAVDILQYVTAALVYANLTYYGARLWSFAMSRP